MHFNSLIFILKDYVQPNHSISFHRYLFLLLQQQENEEYPPSGKQYF